MSQIGLLLLSLITDSFDFSISLSLLLHQNDLTTLFHSFAIKSSMFKGDRLSLNNDNGNAFLSRYVTLPTCGPKERNGSHDGDSKLIPWELNSIFYANIFF